VEFSGRRGVCRWAGIMSFGKRGDGGGWVAVEAAGHVRMGSSA